MYRVPKMTGPKWQPSAQCDRLAQRAQLLAQIRAFFAARDVMEVQSPLMARAGVTCCHIDNFTTRYQGPLAPEGVTLYLQSSPEYAMKRLLAQGSGPIYQLGPVFRNGEYGRYHNPEFTLLEWYRPHFDHHALMAEIAALLQHIGVRQPAVFIRYAQAFHDTLDIDVMSATVEQLTALAKAHGIVIDGPLDKDDWLELLLTHCVQPKLHHPVYFLYDYPASQAALAQLAPDNPQVAQRFECFIEGVEIANGYHELCDETLLRERLYAENAQRQAKGLPTQQIDERFLAAHAAGLPPCAGVALGVDRVLMCLVQAQHIKEVLAFDLSCV